VELQRKTLFHIIQWVFAGRATSEVKYAVKGYRSTGKAEVLTGGKTKTGKDAVAKYDHDMENIFTGEHLTVESKFNKGRATDNQKTAKGRVQTRGGVITDRTTSQDIGGAAGAATTGGAAGAANSYNRKREPN
jgi:hypothetical protein